MSAEQCPRRTGELGPWSRTQADEWIDRGSGRRCSFCGSMHPDDFMSAVERGDEIEPTDKNYKAYALGGKFYYQHLSEAQARRFVDLLNSGKIKIAFPGRFYVRPFFMVPASKAVPT